MTPLRLILWIFLLVLSLPSAAEHDIFINTKSYRFDQISPVSLAEPRRPISRTGPGPESWVKLRFTIKADGSTGNVDVLDIMPSTSSLQDTLAAVASWRFEPAVINDTAVDWHNNIIVINIDLPEIPNISGPRFTKPYSEVQALIDNGNLDQAARNASRNIENDSFSMHDIGLGNMQLAIIEMRRQDMHLAHQAITRATLPEANQLTNEELYVALQYRFNIELSLGRYMDALDTFERYSGLVNLDDDDNLMAKQADQIVTALDQDFVLNAKGIILDPDRGWFFIPSRRTFTITDVEGRLDHIEAVCNRNKATLAFQANVEWSLPESWGECSLSVMGSRDTTFSLYEFPN